MNHNDWVRRELKPLSQSLGFRYPPREEIENRLTRIKTWMKRDELEALLVVQKMNFYYLSGTTQDGLLFLPLEGKPLLMIRRELERARLESPLEGVMAIHSFRDLPSLIQNHYGNLPETLGLEMDMVPVRDYFKFQGLFQKTRILDATAAFR